MGNYEFQKDLLVEENTKRDVIELLKNLGWKILEDNFDYRYDLMIQKDGKSYKLEIKEDFRCAETGNIAVEYECRGKPSGVHSTESDLYLYKVHLPTKIEYHIAWVREIKKANFENKYHRTVSGGDYMSNTKMYLYRYEAYKQLGKVIYEKAK